MKDVRKVLLVSAIIVFLAVPLQFVEGQTANSYWFVAGVDTSTKPVIVIDYLSKKYDSGLFMVEHSYVRYDFLLTNRGNAALPVGEHLWMKFTGETGATYKETSFQLDPLEPGQSMVIHGGPLKAREKGQHELYMGINSRGDPSLPNDVQLVQFSHAGATLSPSRPFDSFNVLTITQVYVVVSSVIVIALAVGLIIVFFILKYINKNDRHDRDNGDGGDGDDDRAGGDGSRGGVGKNKTVLDEKEIPVILNK